MCGRREGEFLQTWSGLSALRQLVAEFVEANKRGPLHTGAEH